MLESILRYFLFIYFVRSRGMYLRIQCTSSFVMDVPERILRLIYTRNIFRWNYLKILLVLINWRESVNVFIYRFGSEFNPGDFVESKTKWLFNHSNKKLNSVIFFTFFLSGSHVFFCSIILLIDELIFLFVI